MASLTQKKVKMGRIKELRAFRGNSGSRRPRRKAHWMRGKGPDDGKRKCAGGWRAREAIDKRVQKTGAGGK